MAVRRIAIPIALAVGILALEIAFPNVRVAYAEIIPLLLFGRALGLRTTIGIAIVLAPLLVAVNVLVRHVPFTVDEYLDVMLLGAVFITVLAIVEHYEDLLITTHRSETESRTEQRALASKRDLAAIAEAIPQLVWTYRSDGSGEYFNEAWLRYTGVERRALEVGGIESAVHPDDVEALRDAWKADDSSGIFEVEVRLRDRRGGYAWFLARATPLFADDGVTILRWFGTCTNIDAQKRAQEEIAQRYADANRISEAFQEASMPPAFPSVDGLRFDAIYRAGRREADIGGDWYDAFRLIDGRIVLSVGDVSGSGLAAATQMVSIRQAIRGAAQIHADPLALLEAADRTLRDASPDLMVTAFVGIYDVMVGRLRYAVAGHPAPRLRGPTGEVRELSAPGVPLGIRRKGDTELAEVAVVPGSLLVMFTDGLIEASRDLIEGERRLRVALADDALHGSADAAHRIARAVLVDGAVDDVAILTVAFDDGPGPERLRRWTFGSDDRAAARAATAEIVASLAAFDTDAGHLGDAETVVGELIGNVVRHAPGPCEVALDLTGELPVLGVLDRGRGRAFTHAPHLPPDAFAEAGRGLFIVRALTVEFSAAPRSGGGSLARAVLGATGALVRRSAPTP